ncbi:MAG: hypothetical protein MJZ43_04470 [Bacteroidaceae bacterium]|nr:hypothetical protein [Candidatus Equimonas faecalis]MCQ2206012.1 hypothetical protein [Bacteroidaceae bacterium]
MNKRLLRLDVLRQIIIDGQIHDQDSLRLALAKEGYYVSQPQLSRDLSRIHAYKMDGQYIIVEDPRFKRIIHTDSIQSH